MDPLAGGGYPAFYEAANTASLAGQKYYIRALRVRLAGLLVAAVGGAVFVWLRLPVVGGWIALIGFLSAIVSELLTAVEKPDRAWYEGRAAAESAKTLTWRYAVRGESFDGAAGSDVDKLFVERIGEILHDLKDVELPATSAAGQITPEMRRIRSSPYTERKATYRDGRIEDQRTWYASKAALNQTYSRRWTIALFIFEGLGVLGGVVVLTGAVTLDLLGVFAASAATVTAWVQAKQFKTLATAYGVTAQELAGVKDDLAAVPTEADWAAFVGQAEEAISREHTLWRASRGVRNTGPRGGGA